MIVRTRAVSSRSSSTSASCHLSGANAIA